MILLVGGLMSFGGSAWGGTTVLKARPDWASVDAGRRVRVDVLANDRGVLRKRARVKIVQRPRRGVAFVTGGKKVLYEAPKGFRGKETFVYRVWDGKGRVSKATVTVKVRCRRCRPAPKKLRLTWSPARGAVSYYEVLFGTRPGNTDVPVKTKTPTRKNAARQEVLLALGTEVPAEPGDRVCFRVRAVAHTGASAKSKPKCTVIR